MAQSLRREPKNFAVVRSMRYKHSESDPVSANLWTSTSRSGLAHFCSLLSPACRKLAGWRSTWTGCELTSRQSPNVMPVGRAVGGTRRGRPGARPSAAKLLALSDAARHAN